LPDSFSHKENQAVIAAALLKYTSLGEGFISGHMKTATDILRVAAALSDGDVSLAEPTKFANLRRHHRVAFLSQLDRFPNREEDMRRWKNRWIRLGERLHPGDYARRFPNAFAGFDSLRNNKPSVSFNSELEGGLAEGRIDSAVTLLASRPGELARRLDHLVRKSKAPEAIVEVFQRKAGDVSTGVLLQVMAHFQARGLPQDLRTFFPKGQVASVYALPDQREPVLDEVSSAITAICEANLIKRFAKLPPLGRAYLDPELRNYLIPFSQRSAAKSLRTLVRGSRLPLPAGNALRFFIWWRNGSSRTDIDLSAALFDNSLKFVDDVAYYNLKNFSGCHSGDIVNAPQGAAEFIDLDIEKTKAHGVRYVVMSINSFTMQPYCDLPECFAGWMSRQHPNSGEIFEPRTVVDKVDVASNSKACLPAIFDLEARQVVWADIALRTRPRFNNVRNNLSGVSLMMRALLSLQKPTLHSLFGLHIKARGHLVANEAEADTIFSVREGITPFDLDRIAAEFI
jgi:hypothetical protein